MSYLLTYLAVEKLGNTVHGQLKSTPQQSDSARRNDKIW